MTDRALDVIRRAIRDHGPITFAEFMDLALYGPGGYYESTPIGAGRGTDFVTSPHVHPVFSHLLAMGLLELWQGLGRPDPFRVSEVGTGDGTLARQLVHELAAAPIAYTAVERSPGAREKLARIAGVRVGEDLDTEADVVLANELLDNLPFRRFRNGVEVLIGLDDDRLVEVCRVEDRSAETTEPEGALAFVDRLGSVLSRGYALLIDYGAFGSSGGPVHGYRDHRVVADILDDPGSTDITAGVDLALIERRAEERGLVALGSTTQRAALVALGFKEWIDEERSRQSSLMNERRGLEAVRTWGDRSRSTLLVDPAALGRLRWLLLATPGLPAPSWLLRGGLHSTRASPP